MNEASQRKSELLDLGLVCFLLICTWVHTPIGRFPTNLYNWLNDKSLPAPWALSLQSGTPPPPLHLEPESPLFSARTIPTTVTRAATRLGVNTRLLNSIVHSLGVCTAAECRLSAPPHLTTILDSLPTKPAVGAYELAAGLSAAAGQLGGNEDLALEALFVGIPNVRRAIHFAEIAGNKTPERLDHHFRFFPNHVPQASLNTVRTILANYRLRYYHWPVPSSQVVTSPFGPRIHPVTRKEALHNGMDIDGVRGAKVVAAQEGEVYRTGRDSLNGNYVKIDHDFGIRTIYCHLDQVKTRVGQRVSSGEQIGTVGSTGRVTGTHLHFTLRVNNIPVDPQLFGEPGAGSPQAKR